MTLPKRMREKILKMQPCVDIEQSGDELGFILCTKDGVYCETGGSYGDWPLCRYPMPTKEESAKLLTAVHKQKLTFALAKKNGLSSLVIQIQNYNKQLVDKLHKITPADLAIYVVQLLSFKGTVFYSFFNSDCLYYELKLFETYDEMVKDFISRHELIPWEEIYADEPDWTKELLSKLPLDQGVPTYITPQEAEAMGVIPKGDEE